MNKDLQKILREIFLGSLAGLTASTAQSSDTFPESTDSDVSINHKIQIFREFKSGNPKITKPFILKRFDEFHAVNLSHRSHRSHSSHRSHYSGSSGSSSGYSSGSSTGSSTTGSYSSGSSSTPSGLYQSVPVPKPKQAQQPELMLAQPKVFKLGDRIIRLGMKGFDVTEVVNILLKKQYLVLGDGSKVITEEVEYTNVIRDAIMQFQRDNGIDVLGIVNPQTVSLLKLTN